MRWTVSCICASPSTSMLAGVHPDEHGLLKAHDAPNPSVCYVQHSECQVLLMLHSCSLDDEQRTNLRTWIPDHFRVLTI